MSRISSLTEPIFGLSASLAVQPYGILRPFEWFHFRSRSILTGFKGSSKSRFCLLRSPQIPLQALTVAQGL